MLVYPVLLFCFFFFFNDTATTEIYTLSLHDALPILSSGTVAGVAPRATVRFEQTGINLKVTPHVTANRQVLMEDRKSTRLNSSHSQISYAVFCLKKKKKVRLNHHPHVNQYPALAVAS